MSELPPPERLHRALCERDRSFEGVFVFGVRTTGVFCRPGCPAKRPRLANCAFFPQAQEALRAGFRPCLRCRPLERGGLRGRLVEQLLALLDLEPDERLSDARLAALGIEPSSARRQFRRYCGLSFQAYRRARRMGLALEDLRRGAELPRAMERAGYESFSGFHASFRALFGASPSTAGTLTRLVARRFETPLGAMLALASEDALQLLEFHDRRGLPRELARLRTRAAIVPGDNALLAQLERELAEYFAGERRVFETPLALEGTPFQRRVWEALLAIPAGETRSYAEIAASIGSPRALRAVGRANGENRLALVVPCHRVIGADGALRGYAGRVWRKRRLLELEGAFRGRCVLATRSACDRSRG